MTNRFVEYDNLALLLAPQAGTTGTLTTTYMDLRGAQNASFLVMFGAITSTTAANYLAITVEAATAEGGTEALIGFDYRVSGIVGANSWGAITSVGVAGYVGAIPALDNNMIWIDLDPATLAANDYRYVRLYATPTDSLDTYNVAVVGIVESRYKQATFVSTTSDAS